MMLRLWELMKVSHDAEAVGTHEGESRPPNSLSTQARGTPPPTALLYRVARPGCAMQGMAHGAVQVMGWPVQLPVL